MSDTRSLNLGIIYNLPCGPCPLSQKNGKGSPVGTCAGAGAARSCPFPLAYQKTMPTIMINTTAAVAQMPAISPPDRSVDDVVLAAAVAVAVEVAEDDEVVVDRSDPSG